MRLDSYAEKYIKIIFYVKVKTAKNVLARETIKTGRHNVDEVYADIN